MKYSAVLFIKLSICLMLLSGCAVGMAASGKKSMDTSILFPGASRAVVISKLGAPETSTVDEEGNYVETYLIVKGNEPSSDRAFMHSMLDDMTYDLWEIIGTPIELLAGSESYTRATIYYDHDLKVREIQFFEVETNEDSTGPIDSNQTGGIIEQNN